MNSTRWLFEYESARFEEENKYEDYRFFMKALKKTLLHIYGLDIVPVEGDDGLLRRTDDDEFIPLSLIVGRREWVKDVGEKFQEFQAQEEAKIKPVEIDSLEDLEVVEEFDDGDILFDDPEEMRKHAIWNSPQSKYIREHEIDYVDEDGNEIDKEDLFKKDEEKKDINRSRLTIDD